MFYKTCERLAEEEPELAETIQKVDALLRDNAGGFVTLDTLRTHIVATDEILQHVFDRLAESPEFPARSHPYCERHEQILRDSEQCDLCDDDEKNLTNVQAISIPQPDNQPKTAMDKGKPIRVLISYSHDSPQHADRVLEFANQLRAHGVDAWIDQYEPVPTQGWPAWMQQQIDRADFVLCVCTEEYKRRFNDEVETDVGRGVSWEANLIRNAIYNSKATRNTQFLVIQFDGHSVKNVPAPLQGYTVFPLKSFQLDDSEYVALYRHLTNQPEVERPAIGRTIQLRPKDRSSLGAPERIPVIEALANPQVLPITDQAIVESEFLDLAEQHRRLCARWNQIRINKEWELIEESSSAKREDIQEYIDFAKAKIREFCNGTSHRGPSEVSDLAKETNQDDELCKTLRDELKKLRIKRAKTYETTPQITLDNLIAEKEAEIARHCSDPK